MALRNPHPPIWNGKLAQSWISSARPEMPKSREKHCHVATSCAAANSLSLLAERRGGIAWRVCWRRRRGAAKRFEDPAPMEYVRPTFGASPWWPEARPEQTPHGRLGCPTHEHLVGWGSLTSPNSGLGVHTCSGFLHLLANKWIVTATVPDLGFPK